MGRLVEAKIQRPDPGPAGGVCHAGHHHFRPPVLGEVGGGVGLPVQRSNLRADGLTGTGVRSASPDARILGGAITGGTTGIDVAAATSISGTSIRLTDHGIRAQSTGLVHADDVDVNAVSVGIDTGEASPFLLTRSHVHALEAVRGTLTAEGTNDLSLPPLNLLGAIGIPLVLLAVTLQAVAALRGRRFGGDARRTPPALPAAAAQASPATAPVRGAPDASASAA